MKRKTFIFAGLVVSTVLAGAAHANQDHNHRGQSKQSGSMMGSGGMHQEEHMGGGRMMMHGQGGMAMGSWMFRTFDTDGDGMVTPDEARAGLEAQLADHDADSDGELSLSEFEALHSAIIRETMVDRFQHLDNDGDGRVTSYEMTASAERMQRMQNMRSHMSGNEGMMNDN